MDLVSAFSQWLLVQHALSRDPIVGSKTQSWATNFIGCLLFTCVHLPETFVITLVFSISVSFLNLFCTLFLVYISLFLWRAKFLFSFASSRNFFKNKIAWKNVLAVNCHLHLANFLRHDWLENCLNRNQSLFSALSLLSQLEVREDWKKLHPADSTPLFVLFLLGQSRVDFARQIWFRQFFNNTVS